ncbi:MAG: pyruvate formate lyase family protein [Eubacteriales bacterium]|jgi:pyruvate-formate lyase
MDEKLKPLYNEIYSPKKAVYCANLYKGRGYYADLSVSPARARANAFAALLSQSEVHVYKNDLIAGSLRGLWLDEGEFDPSELDRGSAVCGAYGERGFREQADHYAPLYSKLLSRGIPGLLDDIAESKKKHINDAGKVDFLECCRVSMEAFRTLILNYADEANSPEMKETLETVAYSAPKTFRQALQLVWMAHVVFAMQGLYAMAFGRIDQYLWPFYKSDIEAGRETRESAETLIANAFMKIAERRAFTGGDDVCNICIGGVRPEGENGVNELSYAVLGAVRRCNIPGPNLSARISGSDPAEFLPECLKVIGTGLGYPALMNDEVNVDSMARLGYPIEHARDFCMVGCIENLIQGRQEPWNDGRFDTPKYIELTLNRGVDMLTGKKTGVDCGDPAGFNTMEQFMDAYKKQLDIAIKGYVLNVNATMKKYNPKNFVNPFLSCLTDDCIGRGLDVCDGGALYPGNHGAAVMGIGTVADSLAAVEKCVYDDKTVTMEELVAALRADFDGFEETRRQLLSAPKYGNNDDYADKYAIEFVDFLAARFDSYKTPNGGHFVILCAANTSNIWSGRNTAATPDGRLARQPISDAGSPTYGCDTSGVTQTVLSLVKPDYTKVSGGSVVNQKFTPNVFAEENLPALTALLRVYFARGGQEMQINSVSRETLKDAMEHPEKYANLVVRVSGFSAYFTRLDKSVQNDILERTEHAAV